jgi:prepilin-type processing-associated H-X9-DG protein
MLRTNCEKYGEANPLRRARRAQAGLVLLALPVLLLGAAIVYPVFAQAREKAIQASCLSNTKSISLRLLIYAQDHDGRLPEADRWTDEIMPYAGNKNIFLCPKHSRPGSPQVTCSYAFNRALSGKNIADIKDPAHMILIFESDLGWNGSGDIGRLPAQPRHNRGDNYGFGDGHAQWVARERAETLSWKP